MKTETVIKCMSTLFCLFGQPLYVHSDRGAYFLSEEFKQFLTERGIASSKSIPHHPTGNSQCEIRLYGRQYVCYFELINHRNLHGNQYFPKPCTRLDPYFARQQTLHRTNVFSILIDAAWLVAPLPIG